MMENTTKQEQQEAKYRELYKNTKLQDIILFRSGPMRSQYTEGTDFFDNSRALFEYMLENKYNDKYELIWLVKNPKEFSKYDNIKNVKFLSFDWEDSENKDELNEYYRALCLAKYIFTTDAYGFMSKSRNDQIRVQLWHGCGFKTRMNFARCENRYEYTTVISDLYKEIHADIYGLRQEQVLVTGYAKNDWLFKPYDKDISELLNINKTEKYIFWLPTFRIANEKFKYLNLYNLNEDTGLPIVSSREELEKLNKLLVSQNSSLIIKLHPFQNNSVIKDYEFSNIKIITNYDLCKKDIVINRMLASADALISDYSSVAVDYLNLDRPIGFTLDDVETYKNSRGFVFDNIKEWLPGKEIFNFNNFYDFIKEIGDNQDLTKEKRNKVSNKMLKFKDNNNCKRILSALGIEKI